MGEFGGFLLKIIGGRYCRIPISDDRGLESLDVLGPLRDFEILGNLLQIGNLLIETFTQISPQHPCH